MYAMTLQHKAIHLLRTSRLLQPYVLYQHIITYDSIKSYPLKYDTERATPQQLQTPSTTLNTKTINHSSHKPNTSTIAQILPKVITSKIQILPSRKAQQKLQKYTQHFFNQTYMSLPWQKSNTSNARYYSFKTKLTISFVKRQLYKLLHIINQKYVATKSFLENLFHAHTKCDI